MGLKTNALKDVNSELQNRNNFDKRRMKWRENMESPYEGKKEVMRAASNQSRGWVWPLSLRQMPIFPKASSTHHLIILITDSLSQALNPRPFTFRIRQCARRILHSKIRISACTRPLIKGTAPVCGQVIVPLLTLTNDKLRITDQPNGHSSGRHHTSSL